MTGNYPIRPTTNRMVLDIPSLISRVPFMELPERKPSKILFADERALDELRARVRMAVTLLILAVILVTTLTVIAVNSLEGRRI